MKKRRYQILRQMGWFNVTLYALNSFLGMVSKRGLRLYRYYLIAQPVAKTTLLPPGRGKKIEVRLTCEQDEVVGQFPRPAAVIRARFEQEATCLAAFKEKRFIGFLWLLLGGYQEDEVRARFIPLPVGRAAWDFDVYVAPDSRLGLAFPRLWDEANCFLGKNNVQWTCSRISAFNAGSLASHARLGTLSMGSAIFLCAGRWQVTLASILPYFHLSSHPSSFPEFRLNTDRLENIAFAPPDKTTTE
ncbi:MAG: hypothetical protein ABIT23_05990 [Nitrosospira sp.]